MTGYFLHCHVEAASVVGIPPRQAERYVSAKAMKAFPYGSEIGCPGMRDSQPVSWAAVATLGFNPLQPIPRVLLTLLRKGYVVDPFQAMTFQTVLGHVVFSRGPDL